MHTGVQRGGETASAPLRQRVKARLVLAAMATVAYAVVALSLAFFTFNRGMPLTIRSGFHPILGDRVWGWPGHLIDILAVFATMFGLATSLGLSLIHI